MNHLSREFYTGHPTLEFWPKLVQLWMFSCKSESVETCGLWRHVQHASLEKQQWQRLWWFIPMTLHPQNTNKFSIFFPHENQDICTRKSFFGWNAQLVHPVSTSTEQNHTLKIGSIFLGRKNKEAHVRLSNNCSNENWSTAFRWTYSNSDCYMACPDVNVELNITLWAFPLLWMTEDASWAGQSPKWHPLQNDALAEAFSSPSDRCPLHIDGSACHLATPSPC